jgi:hypothetical protein
MKKATRAVAKTSFPACIRSSYFVVDDTGEDWASMTR